MEHIRQTDEKLLTIRDILLKEEQDRISNAKQIMSERRERSR